EPAPRYGAPTGRVDDEVRRNLHAPASHTRDGCAGSDHSVDRTPNADVDTRLLDCSTQHPFEGGASTEETDYLLVTRLGSAVRKQRSHPGDRRAFGEPGVEQADVHIRELLQERLTSLRCETVKLAELWHASTVPLLPRGTDNARSWRAVSLQHHHVMTTTM